MRIEPFQIEDYDELISLWQRAGLPVETDGRDDRRRIEDQVFNENVTILVMKTDYGRMVGVVIGSYDGRKGWINRLAVDPEFRGRRLAARLIEKAEEELIILGARVIGALIEEENTPSMAAFRHCGYEGYEKIIYFRKKLNL